MKIITVEFTAKPEHRNAVIHLCRSMIGPSRSEKGCISYNFYQNVADENSFFFFEEWVDQHAIDDHVKTKHYIDFVPIFNSLIIGKAELKVRSIV
ncbi:MAG: putative quinol monooxygenase [Bacteroidota bacterium]